MKKTVLIKHAVKQHGFTLVEIAIVIAIIGLLIGGVLKGQEMITNTKLKRIESDNADIMMAIFSYQDRYRQLPGDDSDAATRFSLYSDGVNDPTPANINGDGDGRIDGNWLGSANAESANIWKHLRAASLLNGSGDDDAHPIHAFGGKIGLRDGSLLINGHALIFASIDGPVAKILESHTDDKIPSSGRIQSDLSAALMDGSSASSAGASYQDSARYFVAFRL